MRRLRYLTLTLAAVALSAQTGWPQDRKPMVPEEGAIEVLLLRQKCIRDELRLTDVEAKQIHEHNARQWKRAQEIDRLPRDQQTARYEVLSRENEDFLDRVLKPSQRKRLEQVSLQVAGLLMATSARISAQLNLTDSQMNQLKKHQDEARDELSEALESKNSEQRERKLEELKNNSRKRLAEVLNDAQEARWRELSGEKFSGKFKYDPEDRG